MDVVHFFSKSKYIPNLDIDNKSVNWRQVLSNFTPSIYRTCLKTGKYILAGHTSKPF